MKHGSLFSGIGGFDLAAEWMGWQNVFHCEINPFANQILKYYWPRSIAYNDIKKTDFTIHRGSIDILTGGFPCQPYSLAGQRKGKDDERHLWPEMLRSVREIAPRWIVGENVYGLLNWSGGLVFDEVQADMEAQGYEVWPFILPACGINAPHKRDRIWFVAYSDSFGSIRRAAHSDQPAQIQQEWCPLDCEVAGHGKERPFTNAGSKFGTLPVQQWPKGEKDFDISRSCKSGIIADPFSLRGTENCQKHPSKQLNQDGKERGVFADTCKQGLSITQQKKLPGEDRYIKRGATKQFCPPSDWSSWPTQSPVCDGNDGISGRLDFKAIFSDIKHPRQPARAFGKWRNESIKGAGNAIVPGVVYQIYKAIELYEHQH